MKRVVAVSMIVAGLLAVGVFASRVMAVAVVEEEGDAVKAAPAAGVDAPADEPKKEEPKKEEPKKRVDPRATLVASAMAAVEAAQKAMEEGNKEAAATELAKAKTSLQALQKMLEPRVRKPAEGAPEGEKKPNADELRKNMEMKSMPGALPNQNAE